MIPYIASQRLEHSAITHGFFGRKGGVSTGVYESLNAGLGSDDLPAHVIENRRRIAVRLGGAPERLVSNHQVHGTDVLYVDKSFDFSQRHKADGLVSNVPGIMLSALHADCAPVLFHDAHAGVIGACHAGWRGAVAGVTDETILAMAKLGAQPEYITAAIGPTISQEAYQVGEDWIESALAIEPALMSFIYEHPQDSTGTYFDIPGYLNWRMTRLGLTVDDGTALCTYSHGGKDDPAYFSYRRNFHAGIKDYGRNLAVIMLR